MNAAHHKEGGSQKNPPKYIFVVGGVMSGIGKGVTTSSIGRILKDRGLTVTAIKIDPYINVDAGTMNPTEHGEVFVLGDGYETDQDMGNYERFLGEDLPEINYMTTGRVYLEVIRKERNLEYKGKNVQVVPDVPQEIIRRIEEAQKRANADVVMIEIGGTVGEYENILFLEAARMLKLRKPADVALVMVSYVPIPGNIGEMKTKPTQHASRSLNSVGLQADIIVARAEQPIDAKRKEKIAIFCNVPARHVISAPDVKSIYDVPLNFERDGLGDLLCEILSIPAHAADHSEWEEFVKRVHNGAKTVEIAVVGKYFDSGEFTLSDSYISVLEALKAAAYAQNFKLRISYLDSKAFETGTRPLADLDQFDGVLIPGGFGETGIEGKIKVIQYVRENNIPYFGLCYGMQLAVIEYARHMAGLDGANTTEIDKEAKYPVIAIMESQKENVAENRYGGTMRLGSYLCKLKKGTIARAAYGKDEVIERHRHRYEVNTKYIDQVAKAGLVFSGTSPDGVLMEIAELPQDTHPFFLGTQFHPEFLSRPLSPHPLFVEFIKAAGSRK